MFGNLAALTARQDDSNKPREPPPPATPLDFPRCEPSNFSLPDSGRSDDVVKLFNSTSRTGPTPKHLQALNVSLANDLPFEQVVPTDFIPSPSCSEAPTTTESAESSQGTSSKPAFMSNGIRGPSTADFSVRVKELLHDNEDGFRTIQRKPPLPNRQPARIVHFRKFWDGLLAMSEYWDTSLDSYSDSKDTEDIFAMDIDEVDPESNKSEEKIGTDKGEDLNKKTYTGRRIGTGRDMPGKHREDTVFSFVEGLTWAFRCRLEQPNSQQRLSLQGTMLPILHAAAVHRLPRDFRQARRGIVEGPMLGVFSREQTSFRDDDEAEGEGKREIMDLLRETGMMLLLAQKRAREGKEEEVPGKDKWWANAPRWGGGVGGEPGDSSEEVAGDATTSGSLRKKNKKASRMDAWKSMQPPSRIWEKNVAYHSIGRDKTSDHDDIYLVSSVNHHVSILHLRIHQNYIDHLQNPSNTPNVAQQPWYILEMKRTKWFDLFIAEDRVEAMRGIWAVIGWQMRDTSGDRETIKEETV